MSITHYKDLSRLFASIGVVRAYMKALSNNDNSKNQIYLGPSLEALQLIPFGEISQGNIGVNPNLKAPLEFYWFSEPYRIEKAQYAQLILYPQYPEVRLSGFLRGCDSAPSRNMQPVLKEQRTGIDGRFLILGITADDRVIAYLVIPGTEIAKSIELDFPEISKDIIFIEFPIGNDSAKSKNGKLLDKLKEITSSGWHISRRLNSTGCRLDYRAPNAGGYTLEALFGIIPNGIAEPDYLGWELKAYSTNKITLMTPEPDAGYYGENGAEAFIRKFGHGTKNDEMYFTGNHKANIRNESTGLTLSTMDYDVKNKKFTSINGGLVLYSDSGEAIAIWTCKRLIAHWAKKHALAAYIKYEKKEINEKLNFRYFPPAHLGEGTDFSFFMSAFLGGFVYYDPAPKLIAASTLHSRVKARSQFRINSSNLPCLYHSFSDELLL